MANNNQNAHMASICVWELKCTFSSRIYPEGSVFLNEKKFNTLVLQHDKAL